MREYNKRPDDELAVITKSKKLCLYVLSVTDKSPKKFRFTLISRLQGYSLDIVEYLYRANDIVIEKNNTLSEQNERLAYQKKAMSTIRLLEYISEIAMLSNCILPKQFEQISAMAFEVKRMLYGWMKSDYIRKNKNQ